MLLRSCKQRPRTHFRRPVLEPLEPRAMLSAGAIELGPSDNIALDQPRVAIELIEDLNPDPDVHQWASVGPSVFNTFLLDTGANSVLAMATAVSDMQQPPVVYRTEGEFEEAGVGGQHPMDISASYRLDFAGTTGDRNTIHDVRILSDPDHDFSMFGPWGIAGMPAMADRVTTMDMRGWSGGGMDLDSLYMKVVFGDELPADEQHRYALSVDNRVAFDPMDYLVSGEPPIWADIPFMTAIPTHNGIGQEGNFLFDTGAQISLISEHLAIAIGLDSNGDGVLDQRDDAYLGSETIGGVGGTKTVPVFGIDEVRVPVTKVTTGETVELVWTDLRWLVLDIDLGEGQPVLDGVFGSDLLTSGWFHSFFYPGQPDGYIDQVHLDFRQWGLHAGTPAVRTGTIYFDLNEAVDNVVMPGPGIRLRETARSTEVVKGVSTDTYTIGLETVPAAPVEITLTAEAPVLVSSDGGATFHSSLVVTLTDTTPQMITVMADDDGLVEGPQTWLIAHTVASADENYGNMAVRDVEVKVRDNRDVVTITSDEAGEYVMASIETAEGGGQVTYWISLASAPVQEDWVHIEDLAGQVTVFNPNNIGDGWEDVWFFDSGNWNTPQPVWLTAIDDNVPEGPHQTQLIHTVLDPWQSEPIVGQQFLTVHVTDNDLGGVLIIETGDGTHVAEGGATDTYQVALATVPTGPVELTVTADSQLEVSADGGATFTLMLVLSFTDTTPQTITVRAIDDEVAEGAHTGTITHAITGVVNDPAYPTTLPIAHVTAAIADNDSAGTLLAADSQGAEPIQSVSVERGGETRYWMALSSRPKHDVTVFLTSSDDTLHAVDDANPANSFLEFTPLNWNVPQAVRIDAGTTLPTAQITHSFFSSDPNYQGSTLLTVTVADPFDPAWRPTDYEQYLLELINRGRLDPLGEAARYGIGLNEGLDPGTISADPKQPLAFSLHLIGAAQDHSEWMLATDTFSHTGEGGSSPGDRMAAAGYSFVPPWGLAENIAWQGTTGTFDPVEFTADIHEGLYGSPGHRENQMDAAFREVGVGLADGPFTPADTTWNALIGTENFAYSGNTVFLTGAVYDDTLVLANQFYTPGEGLGGVTIEAVRSPDQQVFSTETWTSGGYTLAVPSGTYTVTATGGAFGGPIVHQNVFVDTQNVKIDFVVPAIPTYDLMGRITSNGDWWLGESNGVDAFSNSKVNRWNPNLEWADIMVGDFTGNGVDDIAGRIVSTGDWWLAVNNGDGTFTNQRWGRWNTNVTFSDIMVGDFTGDGKADIVGRAVNSGDWWVARSTGSSFTNQKWGRWNPNIEFTSIMAADFTGDGKADIAGRIATTGDWWVARSTGSSFTNQKWGRWNPNIEFTS
ncbi:MAG: FG-GAP-like repeat-containing protein, partial [Thermoguttaceae bacterium]|nr:FG-GAP-like repeat-containing protein [Thermoguttaceae bacterium]